jgi:hypothetical protein
LIINHHPSIDCHRNSLLGVLVTEELGGVDHVGQGLLCLFPLTGLQTTVRINPELIWLEIVKHLFYAIFDLLLAGNTRRVNVVHTGANVARIGLVNEDLEEFGIALAVLDAEDIGIESGDCVEEVLEFGVAEVGVNLCGVCNARSGKAERVDSPGKVVLALNTSAERKSFTERWFIDLDDVDASGFEVKNFVSEGQG